MLCHDWFNKQTLWTTELLNCVHILLYRVLILPLFQFRINTGFVLIASKLARLCCVEHQTAAEQRSHLVLVCSVSRVHQFHSCFSGELAFSSRRVILVVHSFHETIRDFYRRYALPVTQPTHTSDHWREALATTVDNHPEAYPFLISSPCAGSGAVSK